MVYLQKPRAFKKGAFGMWHNNKLCGMWYVQQRPGRGKFLAVRLCFTLGRTFEHHFEVVRALMAFATQRLSRRPVVLRAGEQGFYTAPSAHNPARMESLPDSSLVSTSLCDWNTRENQGEPASRRATALHSMKNVMAYKNLKREVKQRKVMFIFVE